MQSDDIKTPSPASFEFSFQIRFFFVKRIDLKFGYEDRLGTTSGYERTNLINLKYVFETLIQLLGTGWENRYDF